MLGVRVLVILTMAAGAVPGQEYGVVCSTDAFDATGPNNSHKLAFRSELMFPQRDTVTFVFQSTRGIHMCFSGCGSAPWSPPVLLYPGGRMPGIDYGEDGDRHLIWVSRDSAGDDEVYYRNIEYRMAPLLVSEDPAYLVARVDVCADSSGLAHVAWVDWWTSDDSRICYRACNENGTVGNVFVVAEDTAASYFEVSIEQYEPDNALHVVWSQVRLGLPHAYAIMRRRQVGGAWQTAETLASSAEPVGMPSLDFTRNQDAFSAGWYADVARNREVHFEAGNGGGYATAGSSYEPVLTTMGSLWSYLFWSELDAGGNEDICGHFFYGFPPPGHWYFNGTLRQFLGINEDIRAPNCLGALVVWTQGDSQPYKVMWAYFDYPIPVQESRQPSAGGLRPAATIVRGVLYLPRSLDSSIPRLLLDASGRKVMELWQGENDVRQLAPGVYFIRMANGERRTANTKVVIQR